MTVLNTSRNSNARARLCYSSRDGVLTSRLVVIPITGTMDDYDAYLYSIDDLEIKEESDNDVLDNIDEEQAHADTAVVLVPASSPTRCSERESGDEKQPKPSSTVLKSMTKCNRSVDILSSLVAYTSIMRSRVLTESVYHASSTFVTVLLNVSNQISDSRDTKESRKKLFRPLSQVSMLEHPTGRTWMNAPLRRRRLRSRPDRHGKGQFSIDANSLPRILRIDRVSAFKSQLSPRM